MAEKDITIRHLLTHTSGLSYIGLSAMKSTFESIQEVSDDVNNDIKNQFRVPNGEGVGVK